MRKPLNNYLLVSGYGRNSGKTTLACHIISQLSKKQSVIGLKISSHFHFNEKNQDLVFASENFNIYKEKDTGSGKDSSRMLAAGASQVYFVEADDNGLIGAYNAIISLTGNEIAVVCESGSLSRVYKPGIHLLISSNTKSDTNFSKIVNHSNVDYVINSEKVLKHQLNFQCDYLNKAWTFTMSE